MNLKQVIILKMIYQAIIKHRSQIDLKKLSIKQKPIESASDYEELDSDDRFNL